MKRRNFIKTIGLGFTGANIVSPQLFASEMSRSKKGNLPNIIYIMADDMGYGDLSCLNGQSQLKTTHIDRLAQEGITFTDAHSGSAVCTPTRYGILTGRYCWRSRLKSGVLYGYSKHLIEEGRMTVASLLKKHGYATACVGKWHLGLDWPTKSDDPEDVDYSKTIQHGPNTNGFDYFFGISASLDMPPYVYIENDRVTAAPDRETENQDYQGFWRKGPTGADFKHIEVLPTLTKKAADFIDQQAERNENNPFFLYFPLPAPHTPILPTDAFKGKSGTNPYGDFVLQVDSTVGQIMDTLKRNGIEDNTLIIFTSDNGCSPRAEFEDLAQYGHDPSYHFRGHKADIFEGGHRIPFIARWPKRVKPGTTTSETICLTDLMATCAAITGDHLPEDAGEDSYNILPALTGISYEKPIREATVHHSINGSFSIRQGKWKVELCPGSGGWSYPRPQKAKELGLPPVQLYNLEKDIGETKNVFQKHPKVVERLTRLLEKYKKGNRSAPIN